MNYRLVFLASIYGVVAQALLLVFAAPFLLLWGARPAWWQLLIGFVLAYPLPVKALRHSSQAADFWLALTLLNGAIWGVVMYGCYRLLRYGWRGLKLKPRPQ